MDSLGGGQSSVAQSQRRCSRLKFLPSLQTGARVSCYRVAVSEKFRLLVPVLGIFLVFHPEDLRICCWSLGFMEAGRWNGGVFRPGWSSAPFFLQKPAVTSSWPSWPSWRPGGLLPTAALPSPSAGPSGCSLISTSPN